MPKKPGTYVHPNAVVIRSHNKRTIVADHPTIPGAIVLDLTKKYDGPGKSCDFKQLRNNVGKAQLCLTEETMEEIIYAYHFLIRRRRSERVAKDR